MSWFNWLAQRKNARLRRIPADTYPTPTITGVTPTTATSAGGTTITIDGTGFSYGGEGTVERVGFGADAATSFAVVSATQLTAVTPAHAVGAVSVIVRTRGGDAVRASGLTFT